MIKQAIFVALILVFTLSSSSLVFALESNTENSTKPPLVVDDLPDEDKGKGELEHKNSASSQPVTIVWNRYLKV